MGGPSTADQLSVEDPPSVSGDGTPSGGPDTAVGSINYSYNGEGSATSITCTISASQDSLCAAILNAFDHREGLPPRVARATAGSSGTTTTATTTTSATNTTPVPNNGRSQSSLVEILTALLCQQSLPPGSQWAVTSATISTIDPTYAQNAEYLGRSIRRVPTVLACRAALATVKTRALGTRALGPQGAGTRGAERGSRHRGMTYRGPLSWCGLPPKVLLRPSTW